MSLYLVLLLSVLSAVHWSYGQNLVEEDMVVVHHVQPVGGWIAVKPDQVGTQKAVKIAVEKYNTKSKAKKYFKLVDVTSAEIKVTNMISFKITAIIGKTKCLKTDAGDLDSCNMAQKRLGCKFRVTFNPRNDQYEVEFMSCKK